MKYRLLSICRTTVVELVSKRWRGICQSAAVSAAVHELPLASSLWDTSPDVEAEFQSSVLHWLRWRLGVSTIAQMRPHASASCTLVSVRALVSCEKIHGQERGTSNVRV